MRDFTNRARRLGCGLLAGILLASMFGCATSSRPARETWTTLFHRSAKIPADATKEEIVSYVNRNISPIHSWRSTQATVKCTGVLIPLHAQLAVEQPNHFRLMVSTGISGNELDLGSNEEHIWFWAQRMEPKAVMTCRHEEIAAVQDQLPVPFQPEWLMEVLCVSPLQADQAEMHHDPNNRYRVKLVSHHVGESGAVTRKVSTIDLRRGEVTEHELYDAEHRLIAKAELSDYRGFPNTTARLPHHIALTWVEQDLKMNISLNGVEVNPPHLSAEMWHIPQFDDCPVVELHREQLIQPAAGIAGRTPRDKPRAITHYELDAPSGVWMQDQQVHAPDTAPQYAQGATPRIQRPELGSPGQGVPAHANPSANNPYFTQPPSGSSSLAGEQPAEQKNWRDAPGRVNLNDWPAPSRGGQPVADHYSPPPVRTADNSSADEPTAPRKSRDSLIDGVPVHEFEQPVKHSSAN